MPEAIYRPAPAGLTVLSFIQRADAISAAVLITNRSTIFATTNSSLLASCYRAWLWPVDQSLVQFRLTVRWQFRPPYSCLLAVKL